MVQGHLVHNGRGSSTVCAMCSARVTTAAAQMGATEITQFLTSLAVQGKVAASTQNQALSALLFLCREVLGQEVPWLDGLVHAKRPRRLPVVLTCDEVRALLGHLQGVPRLMALRLCGAGLRVLECARLRVKDFDLARNQIIVRAGKGDSSSRISGAVLAGSSSPEP